LQIRGLEDRLPAGGDVRKRLDQVQEMALVAQARREFLLRTHRHRLRKEDLEDCFSQATLELLAKAREGGGGGGGVAYMTRTHMANVLEQRFLSRIYDHRRALGGRSPAEAALAHALRLGDGADGIEVADVRAEIERIVMLRSDLRSIGALAGALSADQRLVLSSLADSGMECAEFCERHGWSKEKYRKVSQRARARLRELMRECEETFPRRMSRSGAVVGEGDRDLL
jgi:DNA-directed RNA polymerase specialized sigma24 family protein